MSCSWSALSPGRCTGVGARWSERSGSWPTDSVSPHGNCIATCSANLFHPSTVNDSLCGWNWKSWICVVSLQRSRPQWISSVAGSLGYLERLSGLLQQTGNQHRSCYMWPWGFQLSPDSSLEVSIWKSSTYSVFVISSIILSPSLRGYKLIRVFPLSIIWLQACPPRRQRPHHPAACSRVLHPWGKAM